MLIAAVSMLLVYAAIGMLVSAAVARSPAGPGFYRLTLLVGSGCLALGFGLRFGPASGAMPLPSIASAVAYAATTVATVVFLVGLQRDEEPPFLWLTVAAAAGLIAVATDPAVLSGAQELSSQGRALYRFGLFGSVPAVGGVVFAMLLAHWYLLEPRMPTDPLKRALIFFAVTQVALLFSMGAIVAYHWTDWTTMDGGLLRAFTLGNALFVAMRAFLGVLAPIGLAWMTWKTVEIRSIQSATGILYAAVVFVLFGETISLYLSLVTGQPY